MARFSFPVFGVAALVGVVGCSSGSDSGAPASGASGNAGSGASGGQLAVGGAGGVDASVVFMPGGASGTGTMFPVPSDFVPGEFGGYKLGDPVTAQTPTGGGATGADGAAGGDV